jgi:CRP-like cAMP-binding protein
VKKKSKDSGYLGNIYQDGEYIVRQGEPGNCMYEIQGGKVVVFRSEGADEIQLAELPKGEFFGEMAIFEHGVRSASVRAVGEARVLTIDKKILLRRITQDPSLAFRILEKMSHRIRSLDAELAKLKSRSKRAM